MVTKEGCNPLTSQTLLCCLVAACVAASFIGLYLLRSGSMSNIRGLWVITVSHNRTPGFPGCPGPGRMITNPLSRGGRRQGSSVSQRWATRINLNVSGRMPRPLSRTANYLHYRENCSPVTFYRGTHTSSSVRPVN